MKKIITLGELYDKTTQLVPSEKHSIDSFKMKILEVLQRDPLRTSQLKKEIERNGESFQIRIDFPINDFYYGVQDYVNEVLNDSISLPMIPFKEYVFSDSEI